MRPLTSLCWGMLIVAIDIRAGGFDLVLDVVGWLLIVYGTRLLHAADRAFTIATVGAVLGGIGSVWQLVPEDVLGGIALQALGLVETAASATVVLATLTGIARVLAHEPRTAQHARTLRTVEIVLTVVALALPATWVLGLALFLIPLAVVTLAVLVWFLVFVWSVRQRPELDGGRAAVAPAV